MILHPQTTRRILALSACLFCFIAWCSKAEAQSCTIISASVVNVGFDWHGHSSFSINIGTNVGCPAPSFTAIQPSGWPSVLPPLIQTGSPTLSTSYLGAVYTFPLVVGVNPFGSDEYGGIVVAERSEEHT